MAKKQTAIIPADSGDIGKIISLALDGLTSEHSRRAYDRSGLGLSKSKKRDKVR